MAAPNRPALLNRSLLALTGFALLAAGTLGLLFGLGRLESLLPGLDPRTPLIASGTHAGPWAPYTAIVAAAIIGLLCLRWLFAQVLRRPPTSTWQLPVDPARGITRLPAAAAADGLAADIETYPGVHTASANLTGTPRHPALHLVVSTEEGTSITALRDRIAAHALPRLCQALEVETMPAGLLLRIDAASPHTTRTR
jgi:hypothetical protein